ncbi:hypothetical protein [Streptomyces sp. NPDC023327]|uniref:hypothetical protein n=1 Tax=Streptomyces sp. NPDC023327 TaxID=3157088 RepID=UPI0033CDD161
MTLWSSRAGLTGGTKIASYGLPLPAGDFDADGTTDLACSPGCRITASHAGCPDGLAVAVTQGRYASADVAIARVGLAAVRVPVLA